MSKNPKVFEIGEVVEHVEHGRCVVTHYFKGEHKPYDLKTEDGMRYFPSFKKDMKRAGPPAPEPYEEWFR